jgi:hypothetical protein
VTARHAVAEYWRLWLRGEVSNVLIVLQTRDGAWRVLMDEYEGDPQPRSRMPPGVGRLREVTGALHRRVRNDVSLAFPGSAFR